MSRPNHFGRQEGGAGKQRMEGLEMEIISRQETHETIAIIDANTIQNKSKQILACCGQERNHKIQNYFQVFDETYVYVFNSHPL